MRSFLGWLLGTVGFLVLATIFDHVQWSTLLDRIKQAPDAIRAESADSPSDASHLFAKTENRAEDASPSESAGHYFPEDTPQLLYEYSISGPVFSGLLSGFEKKLTMIHRVDGFRTINGKRYYKEVSEFTGQEDLLDFLKKPPTDMKEEEFFKSKERVDLIAFLDALFKTTVIYARWDRTGELDVEGDDLTKPETRGATLQGDVGTEWLEQDVRFKAVSIEDVEIGDHTYKDCLKIRASGSVDGTDVQGVLTYNAAGIGAIKMTFPNNIAITLRKYRR